MSSSLCLNLTNKHRGQLILVVWPPSYVTIIWKSSDFASEHHGDICKIFCTPLQVLVRWCEAVSVSGEMIRISVCERWDDGTWREAVSDKGEMMVRSVCERGDDGKQCLWGELMGSRVCERWDDGKQCLSEGRWWEAVSVRSEVMGSSVSKRWHDWRQCLRNGSFGKQYLWEGRWWEAVYERREMMGSSVWEKGDDGKQCMREGRWWEAVPLCLCDSDSESKLMRCIIQSRYCADVNP